MIIIVTLIIYTVFYFIFDHESQDRNPLSNHDIFPDTVDQERSINNRDLFHLETQSLSQSSVTVNKQYHQDNDIGIRRQIGLLILSAMIAIMTLTGINSLMNIISLNVED
jgi:hypothetical protein